MTKPIRLEVSINPHNGFFEVSENNVLYADGRIYIPSDELHTFSSDLNNDGKSDIELNDDDIYKEFRIRGYDYGPAFRGE